MVEPLSLLAALLAAVAAWSAWLPPGRPERRLRTRRTSPSRRRPLVLMAAAWAAVTAVALAVATVSPSVAVCGWCLAVLGGVAGWLWRSRRRRLAGIRAADEVARGCAILAAECRMGRIAQDALAVAAEDVALLAPVARVQRLGGDPVPELLRRADRPGQSGLAGLARAWQVSVRTGAPMADLVGAVAGDLRELHTLDRLVDGELAAPRATSHVLAGLPVAGLALGQSIGARPLTFLTGTPVGLGCLAAGTLLTAAGLVWSELLAVRAGGLR